MINEPCVKPADEMRLVLGGTDFYRPTVLIPSPGATLGPVLQILCSMPCFTDSHGLFPCIRPFLSGEFFFWRIIHSFSQTEALPSSKIVKIEFSLPFNLIIIA